MSDINVALAKAKASLTELELAKQSGSIERMSIAQASVRISREGLLQAKSENSAIDAIKAAMTKGIDIAKVAPHRGGFIPQALR